jgi:hypothetical protein
MREKVSAPRENWTRLAAVADRSAKSRHVEAAAQRDLAPKANPVANRVRASTPLLPRIIGRTPSSKGCAAMRITGISELPERPEAWCGRM